MKHTRILGGLILAAIALAVIPCSDTSAGDVIRPEEIRSKREVIYDQETYAKLTKLWEEYNRRFPSEYAYSNWMYAARYAALPEYKGLLDKGLREYPSNPKLRYLWACEPEKGTDRAEVRASLERAVALDPGFVDPWYLLSTIYMEIGDEELTDVALRRVYESGIIQDCILDYNHNMLVGLDPNGVLVTNGDNDTYPGWILTRILKIRPDVSIINRSLLNTDWYPQHVIRRGAPQFITPQELTALRDTTVAQLKRGTLKIGPGGMVGDTLIARIVEAAAREGRPVYLSATLYRSPTIERLAGAGQILGLVTRATPSKETPEVQVHRLYATWLKDFRSGGLDSWKLRASPATDAARMIMSNYAFAMVSGLDALSRTKPDLRPALFGWYLEHAEPILSDKGRSGVGEEWCKQKDVPEIRSWCEKQGYSH